ncbi:MAG TPA: HAMP domain-containing sensor histidine kinase [Anaerolineaceae bacterium]|nr:HAMP domain-containing sensor histidine kinase [Anaerolineaceae bacterium]
MKITDKPIRAFRSELRRPLNSILSLTEILDEEIHGPLNDRQHQSLRRIIQESQRLLNLTDQFSNLIDIESGQLQPQPATVWLADLCQISVRIAREQAYKKGITIKLDYDNQVETMVTDEWMLKYVLGKLVVSQVSIAPEGGIVTLVVKGNRDENTVRFSTLDDRSEISTSQPFDEAAGNENCLDQVLVRKMVEMLGGTCPVLPRGHAGAATFSLPWNRQQLS